jgi:hypothetical protein
MRPDRAGQGAFRQLAAWLSSRPDRNVATSLRPLITRTWGRSSRTHLGQILTYAAGTDPATVIWVAASFRRPEHRAAIDWLNTPQSERTSIDPGSSPAGSPATTSSKVSDESIRG